MSEETATNAAPMRLRAETPRVTRLSRKMLAGVAAVALLGIGGALIYALQSRDMNGGGEELFSTENAPRPMACPAYRAITLAPVLGPALPGDLGGPDPRCPETGVQPLRHTPLMGDAPPANPV